MNKRSTIEGKESIDFLKVRKYLWLILFFITLGLIIAFLGISVSWPLQIYLPIAGSLFLIAILLSFFVKVGERNHKNVSVLTAIILKGTRGSK